MIAQYPPMGWNSWDCYGPSVTEAQVRANAEYMAKNLKQFGWEYIVVDIQWSEPNAGTHDYTPFAPLCMDAYGRLIPAPNRFPSSVGGKGFRPLADYVHSLGLKFGIHIMRGIPRMAAHNRCKVWNSEFSCTDLADPSSVCKWNPDMYGVRQNHAGARDYYDSIFALYKEWEVDFVKCDDIAREYPHCKREIELISEACRSCGREMVLSLSPGPAPVEQAEHLKRYANMWRITDDFWDEWRLLLAMFERAEKWCIHSAPGHWPDADMLPLGILRSTYEEQKAACRKTYFTEAEQRTMMTLWCMMRSPLMIGSELTLLDETALSMLTNTEVLAIEKESFCAHPLFRDENACVWIAPRKDGSGVYIAAFNLSDEARTVTVSNETAEIPWTNARELWTNKNCSVLSADLAPHDAAVWLLQKSGKE